MVFSCAMSSSYVWLQIIFCSFVNMKARFSPSCDRSCVKMAASRRYLSKNKLGDWMIKWIIRNSQSLLHSTFLMDNCIGHFEVARETGSGCIMGMFRGSYGFFFGANEVAQKTGSKVFPSKQSHEEFRRNTVPVLIDCNFKMSNGYRRKAPLNVYLEVQLTSAVRQRFSMTLFKTALNK